MQTSASQYSIPVLDLHDYLNSDVSQISKQELFVEDLGNALETFGFFALKNHAIPSSLFDAAYKNLETFFLQSDDIKKQFEVKGLGGQRGYTSFGKEHAKDSQTPDLKEFWHVGPVLENTRLKELNYPENLWPSKYLPEFETIFTTLFKSLDQVSFHLLEACSRYLGEKPDRLRNIAVEGNSILRLIHYPPLAQTGAIPGGVRAAAHEDINLITLLPAATSEGLEILEQKTQKWIPVITPPNCIIVDSGDMLQNISNGVFKSTTHRVVNPKDIHNRRFSMPFFVHPRSSVDLSPLPRCVKKTGGKSIYPNITAGEYLMQRLAEIGLKG